MDSPGFNVGQAEVRRETDKALLIYIEDIGDEVWVPKSVIHDDSEIWEAGQEAGELVVTEWFAHKAGW